MNACSHSVLNATTRSCGHTYQEVYMRSGWGQLFHVCNKTRVLMRVDACTRDQACGFVLQLTRVEIMRNVHAVKLYLSCTVFGVRIRTM